MLMRSPLAVPALRSDLAANARMSTAKQVHRAFAQAGEVATTSEGGGWSWRLPVGPVTGHEVQDCMGEHFAS